MKIGLSRPISSPPFPHPDVDMALIARHAEGLGFDHIYYGEHPIRPLDDPGRGVHSHGVPLYQDTLVGLSRISGMTSNIKFGGGVFLMPEHNPIAFAKQLASLDLYSGGRLIVGLGTGWSEVEITLLGGRFDRRWDQMKEAVTIMKALWTQDNVSYDGEFWQVPPVLCYPQPAQKPHPPIMLGGMHERLIDRIVDYADGWLAAFVTPETLAMGPDTIRDWRNKLNKKAIDNGRDPESIGIFAIVDGDVTRDLVKRFEDASLERLAITIPPIKSADEGYNALDQIAKNLL